MSIPVRYIDRIREYYLPIYNNPYKWAHFEDVPFTPLKKSLAESRAVLISTSEITVRGTVREEGDDRQSGGGVYTIAADIPPEQLYTPTPSFDKHATTMEDVGSFYPTAALHEAVKAGRIGSLTERFHGVYNAYSQRHTRERDLPEVLKRCREDGAEVAVLTPV